MEELASNPAEEVAPEESEDIEAVQVDDPAEDDGINGPVEEEPKDPSDDEEEADDASEGEDEEEVEEIELNFGGDKLRVPKGAIPDEVVEKISNMSRNLEAGYTRKFQEVSEKAKSVEEREKAAEKIIGLNDDTLNTYSHGLQIKQELEQLSQVDLNALWQSDPDQARRVSDTISQKQSEFQNVVARVNQQEQELTKAQHEERVRRIEEGRQAVEKRIKNFSEKELTEYAINAGIPEVDAGDWALNPVVSEFAWKAMMFDRMQAKAAKPAKPAPAQPVRSMKGKGGKGQKSITDMSVDEMRQHLGLAG